MIHVDLPCKTAGFSLPSPFQGHPSLMSPLLSCFTPTVPVSSAVSLLSLLWSPPASPGFWSTCSVLLLLLLQPRGPQPVAGGAGGPFCTHVGINSSKHH